MHAYLKALGEKRARTPPPPKVKPKTVTTRYKCTYCYDYADTGKCANQANCKFDHLTNAQAKAKADKQAAEKAKGAAPAATAEAVEVEMAGVVTALGW